jgi:hypothetical protein
MSTIYGKYEYEKREISRGGETTVELGSIKLEIGIQGLNSNI